MSRIWQSFPGRVLLAGVALLTVVMAVGFGLLYSTLRLTHIGADQVACMAWSRDGQRLAVSYQSEDGSIEIVSWRPDGTPRLERTQRVRPMYGMSWNADGAWLTGLCDYGLMVIDPSPGGVICKCIFTQGKEGPFGWGGGDIIAKLEEGKTLLVQHASHTHPKAEWELPIGTLKEPEPLPYYNVDWSVYPGSDGTNATIVVMRPGKVRFIYAGTESGRETVEIPMPPSEICDENMMVSGYLGYLSLPFLSPDHKTLAMLDYSGVHVPSPACVHIWDVESRKKLRSLELPPLPPGVQLLSGGGTFGGLRSSPACPAWSSDSKRFAAAFPCSSPGSELSRMLFVWWDVETGKVLASKTEPMWSALSLFPSRYMFPMDANFCYSCVSWTPTLDKAALARRVQLYVADKRYFQRSIVSVVTAPQEAMGMGAKGAPSTLH